MNRTAAAFVAGAFTAAAALLYSNLNGPVAAFVAGFFVNVVVVAGILSSRPRIRAAADLLYRMAGTAKRTRQERPAAEPQASGLESDVTAALVQLGASKPTATNAARRAVASAPDAGFDSTFRAALQFSKA